MSVHPIFEPLMVALAPPTEKELTAIRSMTEAWKNPELEVIALKISRLEAPAATRRLCWELIDELKAIDARATVQPKEEPCQSPTSA